MSVVPCSICACGNDHRKRCLRSCDPYDFDQQLDSCWVSFPFTSIIACKFSFLWGQAPRRGQVALLSSYPATQLHRRSQCGVRTPSGTAVGWKLACTFLCTSRPLQKQERDKEFDSSAVVRWTVRSARKCWYLCALHLNNDNSGTGEKWLLMMLLLLLMMIMMMRMQDEDDGDDDDNDHAKDAKDVKDAKDAKDATGATYLVHLHAFTVVDFAAFRFTRKRRRAFQNPRLRSLKASWRQRLGQFNFCNQSCPLQLGMAMMFWFDMAGMSSPAQLPAGVLHPDLSWWPQRHMMSVSAFSGPWTCEKRSISMHISKYSANGITCRGRGEGSRSRRPRTNKT